MRLMSKVLLGGLATAALAGTAVAAEHAVHVMNVAMPDGSVAKVRYVGDTPPQVRFVPVAVRGEHLNLDLEATYADAVARSKPA